MTAIDLHVSGDVLHSETLDRDLKIHPLTGWEIDEYTVLLGRAALVEDKDPLLAVRLYTAARKQLIKFTYRLPDDEFENLTFPQIVELDAAASEAMRQGMPDAKK